MEILAFNLSGFGYGLLICRKVSSFEYLEIEKQYLQGRNPISVNNSKNIRTHINNSLL